MYKKSVLVLLCTICTYTKCTTCEIHGGKYRKAKSLKICTIILQVSISLYVEHTAYADGD